MAQTNDPGARLEARLKEIADALGIPVSRLLEDAPTASTRDFIEVLHLFAMITDSQARQRVLTVVRREAERCHPSVRR